MQATANRAAQWGADLELEACLRLVEIDAGEDAYDFARYIRAARRPRPPSLKEQALNAHNRMMAGEEAQDDWAIVRRALEALDD
jgi:cytochrome c